MRQIFVALLIVAAPAVASNHAFGRAGALFQGAQFQPGYRGVLRVGSQNLARGQSRYQRRRRAGFSGRDQSWRLNRFRRAGAVQDPYSYGRCYWRGYYRPRLYCRKYTPRYSAYQSVSRYPGPSGLRGPSYPQALARPGFGAYGGYGALGGYGAYGAGLGSGGAGLGYGGVGYGGLGYGGVTQSRYGYRHPHAYQLGGSGPYGFSDPWGYRLLPAFDFAPILTRLTTVYTIDDPAFDGDEEDAPADGLPQPRTKPVGGRFLTPVD